MDRIDWEKGTPATDYLQNLKYYRSVVKRLMEAAKADPAHATALRDSARAFPQPVRGLIMTEDWCGDSACNTPILASLFAEAGVPLLVALGSEYKALADYYHGLGIDHIPVLSIWDGEGNELGRWIEQPAAVIPKKDAWKAERPQFMKLYAKRETDKDAGREFATLYRQFLEEMADWYVQGMWKETTREVVQLLKK